MSKKQRRTAVRIATALVLFFIILVLPLDAWLANPYNVYAEFALFLVPYLLAGYDVLLKAVRNLGKGLVLDENFLMAVATIGAFALVAFPDSDPHMAEGAAVMLFYQMGELFQEYAVGKSRKSIKEMMDIAPDYANVMQGGELVQLDPYEVFVDDVIVVKPGERIPLDGIVLKGSSQLDTAALTGESVPRGIEEGQEVISGCVNLTGVLEVQVTKAFEESTVSRILELVENAAEKKARTENFITRFARYYTPIVVGLAVLLAIVAPLGFGQSWSDWIERALCFLVVSCPCALVISVPLSFFGGIGGASKLGILIKGSNYLETLANVDTVVFDKTGTLTTGSFEVVSTNLAQGASNEEFMSIAAHAEGFSDHPIALAVKRAYGAEIDLDVVSDVENVAGQGVCATVKGKRVLVGNGKLMAANEIDAMDAAEAGTVLHVACEGTYLGYMVIADSMKEDAAQAISALHKAGVSKTVMLTGDRIEVAQNVARALGLDEFHAELMPQDKVDHVERLLGLKSGNSQLAFVGDGINDAPVLTRSDIGIAMGAMGSDAAIEAADVVLMDDKPSNIAKAIKVARKTMGIVRENIVIALGVKLVILVLAAIGVANMWLAVFGDVGVAVIAILNAMRCLGVRKL